MPTHSSPCLALTAPWAVLEAQARALLAQAAPQAPAQCDQNASHLVVLAWVALDQGDDFRALAQVERAVMLEPQSPAIQLEYALLLSQLDQPSLAQAVVRQLLAQPNVPSGLRQELNAWLSDPVGRQSQSKPKPAFAQHKNAEGFDDLKQPGLKHQSRFYFGFGANTNVNNGLSADRIRLTLPTEVIEFPLDEGERAIAGNAVEWGGEGQWLFSPQSPQAVGPPQFGFVVGASGIEPLGRSIYATQSVQLAARAFSEGLNHAGLYELLGKPLGLELRMVGSWYGQEPLVQTAGASLAWGLTGFEQSWGQDWRCQPELGLGGDTRRYPGSPAFDHFAFNLAWGALCTGHGKELRLGVQANTEQPRNQRPGGVSRRLGLTSSLGLPMAWGRLTGQLQLEYEADSKAYSALLENGERKETFLVLASLVATKPLTKTLKVYGRMESRSQSSNLPLFSSNSFFAGVGLEATFH
ncbi:MAG: hypothetical protein NWS82_07285 [Burkholderiaceae bacterium]|nr:hypothetical protein [Burkholderiaceae bacterium]